MSKEEFDRLMETSPNIPEKIVFSFKNNFTEQKLFEKIAKPEICDILIPTNEYRNPWYTDENKAVLLNENIKNHIAKQSKIRKTNENNKKMFKDFVDLFISLNNREPMESEIFDNLKDKIDNSALKKIVEDNKSLSIKIKVDNDFSSIV